MTLMYFALISEKKKERVGGMVRDIDPKQKKMV